MLSSSDNRGSAIRIGCISDPLTSKAATASSTSLTKWCIISANLSGKKPLHQDRIWRWIGFELAKKRSSRMRLAAASNALLPSAVCMLPLDKGVTDAQTLCRVASDKTSHKIPPWQLVHRLCSCGYRCDIGKEHTFRASSSVYVFCNDAKISSEKAMDFRSSGPGLSVMHFNCRCMCMHVMALNSGTWYLRHTETVKTCYQRG